jgi:hypothetical protein
MEIFQALAIEFVLRFSVGSYAQTVLRGEPSNLRTHAIAYPCAIRLLSVPPAAHSQTSDPIIPPGPAVSVKPASRCGLDAVGICFGGAVPATPNVRRLIEVNP